MLVQRRDISRAAALTVEWIRELPVTMAVFFFISFSVNFYFENLARDLADSAQGPWPAQLGEFFYSLIEGFALLMIGGFFIIRLNEKIGWKEFFRRTFTPLAAESLRSLTRILLWSLLFLIPGFVMYCRLMLVPFVVFVDPTYRDRPDAVARSLELTRHCWFRLTVFIVVLTVFDAVFEMGPSLLKIEVLFSRIIFDFAGFLFSLFAFLILYIIFERLRTAHDEQPGRER